MTDLSGRRGLILGVSGPHSIGFHIARTVTAAGAALAITHRPVHSARAAEVRRLLPDALCLELEAGEEGSMTALFAELEERWGRLDFLVHTIAHAPTEALRRPLTRLRRADFEASLSISVHSLISAAGSALPLLERSDAPRIVALTSHGDTFAIPGYHVLGVGKAALAAAVRYLAAELGPAGVLCNGLRFSLVATDGAVRAVGAETAQRTASMIARTAPTRTSLDGEQVARAVAFMVSPSWQNITGQILTQDGGFAQVLFKTSAPERHAQNGENP